MRADLRRDLRRDLTVALKARDRVAVTALRSALAAIENAEAVDPGQGSQLHAGSADSPHVAGAALGVGAAEAERRQLTPVDVHAIVAAEVAERRTAGAALATRHPERATRLQAEATVLQRYLSGSAAR